MVKIGIKLKLLTPSKTTSKCKIEWTLSKISLPFLAPQCLQTKLKVPWISIFNQLWLHRDIAPSILADYKINLLIQEVLRKIPLTQKPVLKWMVPLDTPQVILLPWTNSSCLICHQPTSMIWQVIKMHSILFIPVSKQVMFKRLKDLKTLISKILRAISRQMYANSYQSLWNRKVFPHLPKWWINC